MEWQGNKRIEADEKGRGSEMGSEKEKRLESMKA